MATAREKLELSKLSINQMEGLAEDVDLERLYVVMRRKVGVNLIDRIRDATIERTMEGASTLEIKLDDSDRSILRSGRLSQRQDVEIDGLWFRLMGVDKNGDDLDLTFEDREIAVLRTYNDFKVAGNKLTSRSGTTRAEFILRMIREVREFRMKYHIPELRRIQPVEEKEDEPTYGTDLSTPRDPGIADSTPDPDHHGVPEGTTTAGRTGAPGLMVKGVKADAEQIANANIILQVGDEMKVARKVKVAAIMTAIQESLIRNLPGGHGTSSGIFQQTEGNNWGTAEDRRNPRTSSRMFYQRAIVAHAADPTRPLWDLCQAVQRSAFPTAYAQWEVEADRFVRAQGDISGSTDAANAQATPLGTQGGEYHFFRGLPPTNGGKKWEKENSWQAIQRLAEEVNFRAFVVSGTFYYISETELFKSKPRMRLTETTLGVDSIDFSYMQNTKAAEVEIEARVKRWHAPPGSVVEIYNMGPINGRWLVASIRRSLFKETATISLKKPRPILPEPLESTLTQEGWTGAPTTPAESTYSGRFVLPMDTPLPAGSSFMQSDGKEGIAFGSGFVHGALDWFAAAGNPIKAPTDCELFRITTPEEVRATTTNPGQVFGGVVGIRELGTDYIWIFRHVTPSMLYREGAHIKAGDAIAAVFKWPSNPSGSHTHIEIFRPGTYPDRMFANLVDPLAYINGKAT